MITTKQLWWPHYRHTHWNLVFCLYCALQFCIDFTQIWNVDSKKFVKPEKWVASLNFAYSEMKPISPKSQSHRKTLHATLKSVDPFRCSYCNPTDHRICKCNKLHALSEKRNKQPILHHWQWCNQCVIIVWTAWVHDTQLNRWM